MERRAYPITEDYCPAAGAVSCTGQSQPMKLLRFFSDQEDFRSLQMQCIK